MTIRSPGAVGVCGAFLFAHALFVFAAPPERAAVRAFVNAPVNGVSLSKRPNGFISFIGADSGNPLPNITLLRRAEDRAHLFLNSNRDLFIQPAAALELATTRVLENDEVGMSHVRVQQLVNGIPVYGAEAVVHITDAGVSAVSSSLISTPLDFSTVPAISSDVALGTAQLLVLKKYGPVLAEINTPVLQIFDIGLFQGEPGQPQLAWFIEASADALRERIWINAQTGELALSFSQLTDARNRRTFNANNSPTIPTTPARTENQGATGIIDVDSAHDFSGDFYNYFFNEHGRDSFDGLGRTIDAVVLYCESTATCPMRNAFWNGARITFGLGFAVDDVVAHELAHAVIDFSADLQYLNESGALNESYADIFGETIDLANGKGNDAANMRWLIGEDLPGNLLGKGIRDMLNPGRFSDPARIKDANYYCLSGDNGGVHINSGVTNHAYALMVDGGTFNGYTIAGIGVTKAAKIQYRALTRYLTRLSKFLDNYNFLIQSCSDLIGTTGITHDDCTQVKLALLSVEMSTPTCSTVNPPATPPPAAPAPVPSNFSQCPAGQVAQNIFSDNLENTTSGNWVVTTASGASHWTGGTGNPAIYFTGNAASGTYAFQGNAIPSAADSSIQMKNSFTLPANALLQFDNRYDFETGFDGGVIEYSTDGGATWQDAGSLIKFGRNYDGGLVNGVGNPLGSRTAFTGHTGQYLTSQLDLGSLAGRSARFRFHMGTDRTVASPGWAIDNVALYTCVQSNPGIVVTPTTGLQTTEAGGSATFTIMLGSPPTANVTINLTSSSPSEGTVSSASVIFTAANWNVPQTFTIQGIDDAVDDGDVTFSIVTSNAMSADAVYNNMQIPDVFVTNIDNDTASVALSPVSGLTTTESGGTATFSMVLTSQPTGNVTMNMVSNKPSEGIVNPASIVFTTANWNTVRTITLVGVDDNVVDGNAVYQFTTSISTSDLKYSALNIPVVNATNNDNDVAGVIVAPASGLTTTEAGGKTTFSVRLNSQPAASVGISLTSSNAGEGTVAPTSLTFNASNWNTVQVVTVSGVDDLVADGNSTYTILTAPAVSTDPNYSNLAVADVSVTNSDNDQANILITSGALLETSESGARATFALVLTTMPAGNVSIPLESSNKSEGVVDRSPIIFTASTWNQPQVVTVTGVDDGVVDGDVAYTIVTGPAISGDTTYNGLNAADIQLVNRDNDIASFDISVTSNLETTEVGGVAKFTVVLTHQPKAIVRLTVTSSNPNEGIVSPETLDFTGADWSTPKTVTVTGVDDSVADGNVDYTVRIDPLQSVDNDYRALNAKTIALVNVDNESSTGAQNGIGEILVITPNQQLVTTEGGGSATFTIQLSQEPTNTVFVPLRSSNSQEGVVAPTSLTFDVTNWNKPQTVTVTGVDDKNKDGSMEYKVLIGALRSDDKSFATTGRYEMTVINQDNESKAAAGAFGVWFLAGIYGVGIAIRRYARARRVQFSNIKISRVSERSI